MLVKHSNYSLLVRSQFWGIIHTLIKHDLSGVCATNLYANRPVLLFYRFWIFYDLFYDVKLCKVWFEGPVIFCFSFLFSNILMFLYTMQEILNFISPIHQHFIQLYSFDLSCSVEGFIDNFFYTQTLTTRARSILKLGIFCTYLVIL